MSTASTRTLLNRNEAAEFLGVRPQTLAAWACSGRYLLRYVKIGRRVRYRLADLERFMEDRTITHTGELGEGSSRTQTSIGRTADQIAVAD